MFVLFFFVISSVGDFRVLFAMSDGDHLHAEGHVDGREEAEKTRDEIVMEVLGAGITV